MTAVRSARAARPALLSEFLGSMNLAITLLVVVAVASVIGTVLKQNEPYTNYVIKFGPFWFEVFRKLGLYDVYGAPWFLAILGFLVLSTGVCLWRHVPGMLAEINHFRLTVQAKSLRAFHSHAEWTLAADPATVAAQAAGALRAQGYRVRSSTHEDGHTVLAALRGSLNRFGYLFTHLAIVVICVGGLLDGNLPLKWKEWRGEVKLETRDVVARDVPPESRLAPGDSLSFRGNVRLPEDSSANFVFLRLRDGFFVQELPFAIELKQFRVEFYPTGQPKNFESDVLIHDADRLKAPLASTIKVNHPLVYRGYAIYQSDFGDGGSLMRMTAQPLLGQSAAPPKLEGRIGEKLSLDTPQGPLTLELDDFRLYNILPVPASEQQAASDAVGEPGRKVRNFGPNFTYRLRNAAGQALEFQNFMQPFRLDGRSFFLSGVRGTPSEEFSYLHIPADAQGTPGRFLRFTALLHDRARVQAVLARAGTTAPGMSAAELAAVRLRLVDLFLKQGIDGVIEQTRQRVPAERAEEATRFFLEVLRMSLGELYVELLRGEGLAADAEPGPADEQFFNDALNALSAIPNYGAPFWLQLDGFEQVQASGLQITKAGGQNVVYLGFALLTAGVFVMFYTSHRRVWVWLAPEDGGTRLILAGSGNRHQEAFVQEFERLEAAVAVQAGAATLPPNPPA